jgi:hypothetical protein
MTAHANPKLNPNLETQYDRQQESQKRKKTCRPTATNPKNEECNKTRGIRKNKQGMTSIRKHVTFWDEHPDTCKTHTNKMTPKQHTRRKKGKTPLT